MECHTGHRYNSCTPQSPVRWRRSGDREYVNRSVGVHDPRLYVHLPCAASRGRSRWHVGGSERGHGGAATVECRRCGRGREAVAVVICRFPPRQRAPTAYYSSEQGKNEPAGPLITASAAQHVEGISCCVAHGNRLAVSCWGAYGSRLTDREGAGQQCKG